jgi:hypothetical protein
MLPFIHTKFVDLVQYQGKHTGFGGYFKCGTALAVYVGISIFVVVFAVVESTCQIGPDPVRNVFFRCFLIQM